MSDPLWGIISTALLLGAGLAFLRTHVFPPR